MSLTTNHAMQLVEKGQADAQDSINNALNELDKCVPYLIARSSAIDAEVTGAHTLYTVPTGKRLIVTQVILRPYSVSSIGGNPSISLGGNASTYNDFATDASRDLDSPNNIVNIPLGSGNQIAYAAAANFSLKINTGATGTALLIVAEVFGYTVDA